ncbi:MAG: 4a-hydroxytetrahydrobiopterin dehydratase [Hydrogenobacter sp.]
MSEERDLKVYTNSQVLDRINRELPEWKYEEGFLIREFHTKNWKETLFLTNAIAYLAEVYWHHPDLELSFKRLKVKLQTHEAGGITDKDFELAREIEKIATIPQRK